MSYDPNNPTTEGRYCPKMGKKCPGTAKGCAFWRTQEVAIANVPRLISNCLFVLHFEAQYQAVAEEMRTQNAINHLNRQIHVTVLAMQNGITVPALSGNTPEDLKAIEEMQSLSGKAIAP